MPQDCIFISKIDIPPTHNGLLNNLTFAVKDVMDIKDQKTSCGNPTWLDQQSTATANAICIDELLANGGRCVGKTILGEFSCGSNGDNHFYGMPPNPKAPERVPGGSSSGSASAVASALLILQLGTDIAGSVRLPASFCGIYGMRPSYGIISMSGVKSFAPNFDTVGIFSRNIDILDRVFSVLAGKFDSFDADKVDKFYVLEDYLLLVDIGQQKIFRYFIENACSILGLRPIFIKLTDIHPDAYDKELGISAIFKKLFCAEIWKNLGGWVKKFNLEFSKDTFVDFSYMASINEETLSEPLTRRELYSINLNKLVSNGSLLCIPTTPDVAPLRNKKVKCVNDFDYEKLRPLVSLSSIGRLPQINIPLENKEHPPIGVSLLSAHKQDYFLINVVKKIMRLKYDFSYKR